MGDTVPSPPPCAVRRLPLWRIRFCSLNIFLAFTATLGNTLILIALHKVSSIHPPTKFLLRCLAMTDFCVGVSVQPLFVAFLMEIESSKWQILFVTFVTLNYTLCGLSFLIATAISVDRLLALLLRLRYRHTVTLRRVRCLVFCFLLVVIVISFIYSLYSRDIANGGGFVIIITSLFLSVFSHAKIFLKLRQHQAHVRQQQEQANNKGIPLDIEQFKKIVHTIAWVQLSLVFCYFPMFIFLILSIVVDWYKVGFCYLIVIAAVSPATFVAFLMAFLLETALQEGIPLGPLTRTFTSKRVFFGEKYVCVDGQSRENHRQKLGLVC